MIWDFNIHDGCWEIGLSLWPWTSAKVCAPPPFPPPYIHMDADTYLTSLANVLQAALCPLTDKKNCFDPKSLTCLLSWRSPTQVFLKALWIQCPSPGGLWLFPVLIWYNWSWKMQLGTINYSFSIKYLITTETMKILNAGN